MKLLSGLSAIIDKYDALLLDLWGVVHDGTHLYPGVAEVLEKLHAAGKKIIFVSNAPRRASRVVSVLTQLGIRPELYQEAISSGEMGYRWLEAGKAPWGKHYFYVGPSKDADVLNGLDYVRVDDIKHSDFLLNVGFGTDEQSSQDWMPLFRSAKALSLPMLCLNPDLEVVKQTGEHYPCAGVLAQAYMHLGGEVTWFGKPYIDIYDYCFAQLAPLDKSRILGIGDSLETDIPGGLEAGIDVMLVTGGILKKRSSAEINELCHGHAVSPTYIAPALSW